MGHHDPFSGAPRHGTVATRLIYVMEEYESSLDPGQPTDVPRTGGRECSRIPLLPALILFAVILVLLLASSLYWNGFAADEEILISEWGLIFIPCMLFLRLFRVDVLRGLKVTPLSMKSTAGVVFASISGLLLTGELVVCQNEIFPFPPDYLDMIRELFEFSGETGVYRALFAFALSPAICEEVLFRGVLLRSLIGRYSRFGAILLTGLLFGLFHLDPYRLVGTMVLGFIMGSIAVKAESLPASMLYHLTNNLVILMVMNAKPFQEIPWLMEEAHLPLGILIPSAITFVISLRAIGPRTREGSVRGGPRGDRGSTGNISRDDP